MSEEIKVTNHYRVEVTNFEGADSSSSGVSENESEEILAYSDGKIVHWPPASSTPTKFEQKIENNNIIAATTTEKYSEFNKSVESATTRQSSIMSSEHFKPGKLNTDRWKPVENQTINIVTDENPVKPKFKALDDIYQSSNAMTNHRTYHVPPGTTRTRKAQDNYTKHLKE